MIFAILIGAFFSVAVFFGANIVGILRDRRRAREAEQIRADLEAWRLEEFDRDDAEAELAWFNRGTAIVARAQAWRERA